MEAIRYDFAGLSDGHAGIMTGSSGFSQHSQDWSNAVKGTVMTWLSQDGADFGNVNELLRQAETNSNDFLTRLGTAVQACNNNAQETLAYCQGIVNG